MKKIFITLLQLAVTIAVLYWVFHDPNKRAQMGVALRTADYTWIAIGIVIYLVVEIAAAARWQVLLRVQDIHLSLPRMSGLFFIGMFYNQFLPGGTGGDIMKSYLLLKETPGKKATGFLVVLMDRLVGLLALITLAGVLIGLRYHWLTQSPTTAKFVYPVLGILLAGRESGLPPRAGRLVVALIVGKAS